MAKNLKEVSDVEMSAKESSQVDAINISNDSCHLEEDLGVSGESDIPEPRKIPEDPDDNVHKNELTEALIRRPNLPNTDCEPASFELQTLDQDHESACVENNSYDPKQKSEVLP